MSRTERGFGRDWVFSTFHRSMPPPAYMIDIDTVECCRYCKEPISLSEVARDVGQDSKAATIVYKLARKANIMAFLIFYKHEIIKEHVYIARGETELITKVDDTSGIPTLTENQLQVLWKSLQTEGRKVFRMRQLYPAPTPYYFTPQEFYDFLSQLHRDHESTCSRLPQRVLVTSGGLSK